MNQKTNMRIFGLTQTQFAILLALSGLFLCIIVLFGGYIIYELRRPVPVAIPPTSTRIAQSTVRPTNTLTLTPEATARPTFTDIPTATSFVLPTIDISTLTPTATVTATVTTTPPPIQTAIASLAGCEKTIYENFSVILQYPPTWGCEMNGNIFSSTGSNDEYVEIMFKGGSRTTQDFCQTQVQDPHGTNQFGQNPIMQTLLIDNQQACLILPSADQAPKLRKISLLVVTVPSSIADGTLLLLYADKNHIRGFASTLKFAR